MPELIVIELTLDPVAKLDLSDLGRLAALIQHATTDSNSPLPPPFSTRIRQHRVPSLSRLPNATVSSIWTEY